MRLSDTPVCILAYIFLSLLSSVIVSNQNVFADVSDALITAQVKSAFFIHPQTKVNNIHVETNGSEVFLSGEVYEKEAKIATFISKTVPGVQCVNTNGLMIKPAKYWNKAL